MVYYFLVIKKTKNFQELEGKSATLLGATSFLGGMVARAIENADQDE